jgi:amidase
MGAAPDLLGAASAAPERLEEWLQAAPAERKRGLQAARDRIRRMDPSIHAWVQVRAQRQNSQGPLSGIPIGVKDIIEVRGLALEYGSPVYKGHRGSTDAAIVARLRALGAIVMGKTHTAAFAYRTPAPTRNPRNLDHTPGGSSSGSAAAVAAGMVPVALGTQTLGSVLRPASYCGITGFKPTFGLLPMDHLLPFASSLDTLGFFTHTPAGMILLWEALGYPTGRDEELALGVPQPLPEVDPEMAAAFRETISRLRTRGLAVEQVPIAAMLSRLAEEARVVSYFEGARFHQQRYQQHGDRLLHLADLVREGLAISESRYRQALASIAQAREEITGRFRSTPVILTPAATGPAPRGLASTGDARMNSPWTALGTPAISIPMPVGDRLPLGIQLTAAHGEQARLLRAAVRVARLIERP